MPSVVAIPGEWTPCGTGELKLYPTAYSVSVYVSPSAQVLSGQEAGHIVAPADTETLISAKTTEKVWVRPLNAARVVIGITAGATGAPLREVSREFFCVNVEQPNNPAVTFQPPWGPKTFRVLHGTDYPITNPGRGATQWSEIERTAGVYTWTSTDNYCAAVRDAGYDTIVLTWLIYVVPYFRLSNLKTNVAVSAASPCVCTKTGHGYFDGYPIVFTTGGATLPSGGELVQGTVTYYVKVIDANSFNLSLESDLSPLIATTGTPGNGAASTAVIGTPSSNFYKTAFIQNLLYRVQVVNGIKNIIFELPNEWYTNWRGTDAELQTECLQIKTAVKAYDNTIPVLSMPVANLGIPYPSPGSGQTKIWDTLFLTPGFTTLFDEVAFHQYPISTVSDGNYETKSLDKAYAIFERNGLGNLPVNITESAVYTPGTGQIANRVTFLGQTMCALLSRGVKRYFPWHWDGPASSFSMSDSAGMNAIGVAYNEMTKWWIGATIHDKNNGASQVQEMNYSRVYAGEAIRGRAVVVADASGATPAYPVPSWATVVRRMDGTSKNVQAGGTYTLNDQLVVFEG